MQSYRKSFGIVTILSGPRQSQVRNEHVLSSTITADVWRVSRSSLSNPKNVHLKMQLHAQQWQDACPGCRERGFGNLSRLIRPFQEGDLHV